MRALLYSTVFVMGEKGTIKQFNEKIGGAADHLLFEKSSASLLAIMKGSIITKRVLTVLHLCLLYSVPAGFNREFDTSL